MDYDFDVTVSTHELLKLHVLGAAWAPGYWVSNPGTGDKWFPARWVHPGFKRDGKTPREVFHLVRVSAPAGRAGEAEAHLTAQQIGCSFGMCTGVYWKV